LGLALIAGGMFSFLPVLGIWMLPIGALLIGEDIPPVRRATLWMVRKLQLWWDGALRHDDEGRGVWRGSTWLW
jgi:hypothetical protein